MLMSRITVATPVLVPVAHTTAAVRLGPLGMIVSCCRIIGSFGLFILVVNAALLGLTAWTAGQLDLNFSVSGFWSALFGALIISMVAITANMIVRRPGRGEGGESGRA